MMYRKFLSFIILLMCFFTGFGQGHRIEVTLPEAAGKDVVLANYYLGGIYAKDTVAFNSSGKGVFASDTLLPQGMYKIFIDQDKNFDFIIGADQTFSMINTGYEIQSLRVEGADETKGFVDYMIHLRDLQQKASALNTQIQSATGTEKEILKADLEGLTNSLHAYWDQLEIQYPNSFLARFVKANYVPSPNISSFPKEVQQNDSLLLRARFYFQREHFWDNFDYTDERFLYTPFYKQKLETWFTKVLYQEYDSIRPYVLNFIEEVKPQKRIFQFATSWFLNSSINSNIMGMDALFVEIAQKYYLSGAAFWATEESLEKIKENVLFAEHNLIGMKAPDLTLEGVDGEYFNLHQIDAPVTIVLIYEPNCSHCKVFVPEFHSKVYHKYKNKGLEVYAIYSMDNKQEWTDFLSENNMYDWINVWDEHHVSRFKILYDARKTPGVYVLDKQKNIIAKKMSVEQLEKYMEQKLN